MVSAVRTIGHEERLSLVGHLEELRARLIVSGLALAVAFGVCLWQNHALLDVINKPVRSQTARQVARGEGPVGQAALAQQGVLKAAADTRAALQALARPDSGLSPQARAALAPLIGSLQADVRRIPRQAPGNNLVTLGVGEPFTTTVTVSLYFALILSLPLILFELYGFVLPALTPSERRAALPLLLAVPVLFCAGVLFGYFVVLPAAVRFFLNFNASEFNVLVQASQFYGFAATILLAMGLVFQVPVAILGATRLGFVTPAQLRRGRRYALVACAAIAALLPGDLVTLALETVPLYVLYEASILVASFVGRGGPHRRDGESARDRETSRHAETSPPQPFEPSEQAVQQIIDHTDPRLSD